MKTAEQEEKQKAFLQRAKANLKNNDLHRSLIAKHIEPLYQQPFRGSIQSFEESGHVSGSFMLALMDYAEAYANQSRWIAVEERLPEIGEEVLWVDTDGNQFTERICEHDSTFLTEEWFIKSCSHWQFLPDKPTEPREEENGRCAPVAATFTMR